MSPFNIEAIEFQIASEIRTDDEGRGFFSVRAVARLFGIDHRGLGRNLKSAGEGSPSAMARYLIEQGFDSGDIFNWSSDGIPDLAVASIGEYFIFEKPASCTDQTKQVYRTFSRVGIRTYSHKITGWEPKKTTTPTVEDYKLALMQMLQEQIPEVPSKWTCRYPVRFWKALEELYGLKRGQRACGNFIKHNIYKYFPVEVQERLNEINPILDNGYRKNTHHQHFDDVLLQLLQNHIEKVIVLLETASDIKSYRMSVTKLKKISFNVENVKYLESK